MLTVLVERAWLAPGPSSSSSGRPARRSPRWPPGLELSGEKRYGETAMWFAEPTTDDVVA